MGEAHSGASYKETLGPKQGLTDGEFHSLFKLLLYTNMRMYGLNSFIIGWDLAIKILLSAKHSMDVSDYFPALQLRKPGLRGMKTLVQVTKLAKHQASPHVVLCFYVPSCEHLGTKPKPEDEGFHPPWHFSSYSVFHKSYMLSLAHCRWPWRSVKLLQSECLCPSPQTLMLKT